MGTLYIKDKACPFCFKRLINSTVYCPNNITIPCLECKECKVYLFKEEYYNVVYHLAINNNRQLNHDVYKYQEYDYDDYYDKLQNKKCNNNNKKNIKNRKSPNNPKRKTKKYNKTISSIPLGINVIPDKAGIKVNCRYGRNGYCFYMDNICNPYSVKCKNPVNTDKNIFPEINKKTHDILSKDKTKESEKSESSSNYATAIVLSNNKKCIEKSHAMLNVDIAVKISDCDGMIKSIHMPAAYCKICDAYFVLKTDYKIAKKSGALLCYIEDMTYQSSSNNKNNNQKYGNESNIHKLGYNVKKNITIMNYKGDLF